jgi:hypothetical protein
MKARPQRNARCNRWIRSPNVIPAPLPVLWMALDEGSTHRACQPLRAATPCCNFGNSTGSTLPPGSAGAKNKQ